MFSLRVGSLQIGIIAVLALVLLLAPSAAAQSFTITVEAAPITEPVPAGGRGTTELTVTIETNTNILCVADSTVRISLSDAGQDPIFTSDFTPPNLDIPLETGLHGPAGAFQNSATSTFTVNVGSAVPRLHPEHKYRPTATFLEANPPSSCQAAAWQDAEGFTDVSIVIQHPPEEENGEENGANGTPGNGDGGDENDSPAPGVALLVLVGVLLARLRRRR